MHLADTSEFVSGGKYGFDRDNYIGATRQINAPRDSWIDFFRECRLEPQFRMAEHYFESSNIKAILNLFDKLPELLNDIKKMYGENDPLPLCDAIARVWHYGMPKEKAYEEALALIRKGINPISFPGLKTSITSDDSKAINFVPESY